MSDKPCKFDSLVEHVADECPLCNPEGWMAESQPSVRVERIEPALALCPECKAPIVVIDGTAQGKVTLWNDSANRARVTPHTDDCTAQPPYDFPFWGI